MMLGSSRSSKSRKQEQQGQRLRWSGRGVAAMAAARNTRCSLPLCPLVPTVLTWSCTSSAATSLQRQMVSNARSITVTSPSATAPDENDRDRGPPPSSPPSPSPPSPSPPSPEGP